ncbi:hypothetical protein GXP67_11480 [Rhodocytophaga rosea]|uniref:DUF4177 domain-containing protein n=1 Tax=Rhodocytophaga rosea TaxID=2704465 RepID=A0A6C0GGU7_9BACT|nr:hypothetical protein [Rhodocytophaga rosea]QHT67218.1 hypothetical protein GXP67_11480 [Rhodocytophaga rosea]
MKTKSIMLSSLFTLILISLLAFKSAEDTPNKTLYMEVATIESIIPAGGGRSKMIITLPDGNQKEAELENLYSISGINFDNVQSNERAIIEKINQLTAEGWELQQVTSGVQSPSPAKAQGIYMTRYLFKK